MMNQDMKDPVFLTPEYAPVPERVRLAMSRDTADAGPEEQQALQDRVQTGLGWLLGTKQPVSVLAASLSGAMSAVLVHLFDPGEKVLVVEAGQEGLRWSDTAQARGLEVVALPIPWGQAVRPREVENALSRWPDIAGVLVQAVDVSTAVMHPVRDLSALCRRKKRLLIVDGTAAVGISPCSMDVLGLDCLLSASGPFTLLPAGMAFAAVGDSALSRKSRAGAPEGASSEWCRTMLSMSGRELSVPCVILLQGLESALDLLRSEGLEKIHQRHRALAAMVRAGTEAMGLQLLASSDNAWGVSAVCLPPGIDQNLLLQTAGNDYQVILARGSGRLRDRILRMGHMGCTSWKDVLAGLLALHGSYRKCGGVCGARDYLERAWLAYELVMSREQMTKF